MRRFWELAAAEKDTAVSQVLRLLCIEKDDPTLIEAERLSEQAWYPAPEDFVVFLDPLDSLPIDENGEVEELRRDLKELFEEFLPLPIEGVAANPLELPQKMGAYWRVTLMGRVIGVRKSPSQPTYPTVAEITAAAAARAVGRSRRK